MGIHVPVRMVAAGIAAAALAAVMLAVPAAHAAVWTVGSGEKVYPHTTAGRTTQVTIMSAANEYEGAQVVLSAAGERNVTFSWSADSADLLRLNTTISRVGYVTVTQPSSYAKSKAGDYPDPLIPMQFGQAVHVPAQTTSFYLLVHVPAGTSGGDYTGSLQVDDAGQLTVVPVTVHVWAFELPAQRVATCFPIGEGYVHSSLRNSIPWSLDNQRRVFDAYYRMFEQHGLAPAMVNPVPPFNQQTGHASLGSIADVLSKYLDPSADGPGFSATRAPLDTHWPIDRTKVPTDPRALTYLTDVFRFYKANGWQDKAYTWVYDEPSPKTERFVEKLARVVHKASAAAGYRAKVLVTDEPRPVTLNRRPPNSFLFDDIDIWCTRIWRYWDAYPAIKAQVALGKQVWMYTYADNPHTSEAPTFLIDEPTSEEQSIYWMMWRWNASGLVYWQSARWVTAGGAFRDPYQHPVSFSGKHVVFNGEASLIYPGYEPSLGLNDPYAAPVSSLRFEALRDGAQQYAYLQLAAGTQIPAAARTQLHALANSLAAQAAYFPAGYHHKAQYNLPTYRRDPAFYANARIRLGTEIELAMEGQPLTAVAGRVVDAGGKPVAGARVSDGLLAVVSGADGSFTMVGALPGCTLSVQKAGLGSATLSGVQAEHVLLTL